VRMIVGLLPPTASGIDMRLPLIATVAAFSALALTPAAARTPPTPESRISRLEYQVRQVQKTVFPKGAPADTAGFVDDPAASQEAVNSLGARLDSVERQIADLTRASEENGNRLATMEAELARLRADQERRLRAIESGSGDNAAASTDADPPAESSDNTPPPSRPRNEAPRNQPSATLEGAEAAYDAGFRLWEAKKYDSAIASLRKMIAAYPEDRRVSWANNLIGRAMLDKGQYRQAAEALLANYRGNKDGERAPDSLYYLGQASMKLGQPTQACKAYAELENAYGSSIRPALRNLLPAARAEAKCR
jgi:TolA-binding protein